MNTKKYDICVIGGGASGMAAAVSAGALYREMRAETGAGDKEAGDSAKIIILEKKDALGRKVAASGNGRCNITNTGADNASDVTEFLESIGIVLRTEDEGRMYPYSGRAGHVIEVFEKRLEVLGIEIRTGTTVLSVGKNDDTFIIKTENDDNIEARKVIIATGGKSSPQFGTTGDGYAWAKSFGHAVTRLAPALTNFELVAKDYEGKNVKGVRAKAVVTLLKSNKKLKHNERFMAQEKGEVQFTETGVSGICIFNLSRFARIEEGETVKDIPGKYEISIDLMPEYNREDISIILRKHLDAGMSADEALLTIVDEKLIPVILKKSESVKAPAVEEKIASVLQDFRCSVSGMGGWKTAQVTSGGVKLSELDRDTMESLIVKGLYFTGEILDYDGPCGGFNLNNAWFTGIKAGRAAAKMLFE